MRTDVKGLAGFFLWILVFSLQIFSLEVAAVPSIRLYPFIFEDPIEAITNQARNQGVHSSQQLIGAYRRRFSASYNLPSLATLGLFTDLRVNILNSFPSDSFDWTVSPPRLIVVGTQTQEEIQSEQQLQEKMKKKSVKLVQDLLEDLELFESRPQDFRLMLLKKAGVSSGEGVGANPSSADPKVVSLAMYRMTPLQQEDFFRKLLTDLTPPDISKEKQINTNAYIAAIEATEEKEAIEAWSRAYRVYWVKKYSINRKRLRLFPSFAKEWLIQNIREDALLYVKSQSQNDLHNPTSLQSPINGVEAQAVKGPKFRRWSNRNIGNLVAESATRESNTLPQVFLEQLTPWDLITESVHRYEAGFSNRKVFAVKAWGREIGQIGFEETEIVDAKAVPQKVVLKAWVLKSVHGEELKAYLSKKVDFNRIFGMLQYISYLDQAVLVWPTSENVSGLAGSPALEEIIRRVPTPYEIEMGENPTRSSIEPHLFVPQILIPFPEQAFVEFMVETLEPPVGVASQSSRRGNVIHLGNRGNAEFRVRKLHSKLEARKSHRWSTPGYLFQNVATLMATDNLTNLKNSHELALNFYKEFFPALAHHIPDFNFKAGFNGLPDQLSLSAPVWSDLQALQDLAAFANSSQHVHRIAQSAEELIRQKGWTERLYLEFLADFLIPMMGEVEFWVNAEAFQLLSQILPKQFERFHEVERLRLAHSYLSHSHFLPSLDGFNKMFALNLGPESKNVDTLSLFLYHKFQGAFTLAELGSELPNLRVFLADSEPFPVLAQRVLVSLRAIVDREFSVKTDGTGKSLERQIGETLAENSWRVFFNTLQEHRQDLLDNWLMEMGSNRQGRIFRSLYSQEQGRFQSGAATSQQVESDRRESRDLPATLKDGVGELPSSSSSDTSGSLRGQQRADVDNSKTPLNQSEEEVGPKVGQKVGQKVKEKVRKVMNGVGGTLKNALSRLTKKSEMVSNPKEDSQTCSRL